MDELSQTSSEDGVKKYHLKKNRVLVEKVKDRRPSMFKDRKVRFNSDDWSEIKFRGASNSPIGSASSRAKKKASKKMFFICPFCKMDLSSGKPTKGAVSRAKLMREERLGWERKEKLEKIEKEKQLALIRAEVK